MSGCYFTKTNYLSQVYEFTLFIIFFVPPSGVSSVVEERRAVMLHCKINSEVRRIFSRQWGQNRFDSLCRPRQLVIGAGAPWSLRDLTRPMIFCSNARSVSRIKTP